MSASSSSLIPCVYFRNSTFTCPDGKTTRRFKDYKELVGKKCYVLINGKESETYAYIPIGCRVARIPHWYGSFQLNCANKSLMPPKPVELWHKRIVEHRDDVKEELFISIEDIE